MPELIRLYIRQCFIGFGIAILFVGMLYAFNVANLWTLVSTSGDGLLVTAMLVFSNAVVFCGVQFAIAVMRMAEPEEDKRGGGTRAPMRARLEPSKIPVVHRPDPRSSGERATERAYL